MVITYGVNPIFKFGLYVTGLGVLINTWRGIDPGGGPAPADTGMHPPWSGGQGTYSWKDGPWHGVKGN